MTLFEALSVIYKMLSEPNLADAIPSRKSDSSVQTLLEVVNEACG